MSTRSILSLYRTYSISFSTAITLLIEDNGLSHEEAYRRLRGVWS